MNGFTFRAFILLLMAGPSHSVACSCASTFDERIDESIFAGVAVVSTTRVIGNAEVATLRSIRDGRELEVTAAAGGACRRGAPKVGAHVFAVVKSFAGQANGTCYGAFEIHETLDAELRGFLDVLVDGRKKRRLRVDGLIRELLALRTEHWFMQPPPVGKKRVKE